MSGYPGFLTLTLPKSECAKPCAGGEMKWSVTVDHDKVKRKIYGAQSFRYCTVCEARVYEGSALALPNE